MSLTIFTPLTPTVLPTRLRETITESVSEIQSDSLELQQKALQALSSITNVNPQTRNFLAHTENAVPSLLSLTNSPSPTIQSLSVSILFNLSLNPELKQSLAQMETIYRLHLIIISPKSPESSKLASSLICSLAMLDKNKAKFGVAGTIQLLVKSLALPPGPDTHHLLSSLAELVQFHGNCTLAVRSGAVSVLIRIVESTDGEDLAGTALTVMGLLARFDEGMNELRKTNGIVGKMAGMLKGRCMLSKEGAAEILVRLFDESEECLREASELNEFSNVLADLSVRGSMRAREKAGLLLSKISKANRESMYLLQW